MKNLLLATLIWGTCAAPFASAQTLLLDYNFNGSSSSTVPNLGTLSGATLTYHDNTDTVTNMFSAPGTGVSGAAGDTALNNTSAGAMGSAGNNPAGASTLNLSTNIGTLGSFTISGWYNASVPLDNNVKLFDLQGGTNDVTLLAPSGNAGERLALSYNGTQESNSLVEPGYAVTGSWVFFAVTYNGQATTNNLNFYIGTSSSSVALAGSRTITLTGDIDMGSSVGIGVGNGYYNNGSANRPLDGLMDDVDLYGASAGNASGALSQSQLETIRALDVVPEPGALGLMMGGFGIVAIARRLTRSGTMAARQEFQALALPSRERIS